MNSKPKVLSEVKKAGIAKKIEALQAKKAKIDGKIVALLAALKK